MQLGMIGLGRMGANMVRRLIRKGHSCVVFDRSPEAVGELVKEKEIAEDDARRGEEEIQKLTDRRIAEIDHALAEKEADVLKI